MKMSNEELKNNMRETANWALSYVSESEGEVDAKCVAMILDSSSKLISQINEMDKVESEATEKAALREQQAEVGSAYKHTTSQKHVAIDQQIIELLSSGDSRAHKRLVELYGQSIFATIARMVPDLRDAEELTQDTLFTAIARIRDFDSQKSGFFSWLCRIAYNKAVDFLRRSKPTVVSLDTNEAELADISDEQIEAGLSSGQEERIVRLQQAVEALPPYDRMIISLYYYDSHPLAEIATILNSTPGAIAKRLMRIRRKLFENLNDNG